jgi:hypothetical protein
MEFGNRRAFRGEEGDNNQGRWEILALLTELELMTVKDVLQAFFP